jgi:hypothetical protein
LLQGELLGKEIFNVIKTLSWLGFPWPFWSSWAFEGPTGQNRGLSWHSARLLYFLAEERTFVHVQFLSKCASRHRNSGVIIQYSFADDGIAKAGSDSSYLATEDDQVQSIKTL